MLHAPDFLGYDGAVELARDAPRVVERGLRAEEDGQRADGAGRRSRDPPDQRARRRLLPRAERSASSRSSSSRSSAPARRRWRRCAGRPASSSRSATVDCELVALSHPDEYAIERGRIRLDPASTSRRPTTTTHFVEEHVERSNALHSLRADGGTYLCGPLARYTLNSRPALAARARGGARAGPRRDLPRPVQEHRRPQRRARLRLRRVAPHHRRLRGAGRAAVPVEPVAGTGFGVSEAPRGLLYHRYRLDAEGTILDAKIVPPTSQNQQAIEDDLHDVVARNADLGDDDLRALCEQTIRNYDPCISCATHFLDLKVERR